MIFTIQKFANYLIFSISFLLPIQNVWIQNRNRTSIPNPLLMNPIPTQIYTIPTQVYTILTPNPIPLHMIPNPESNPDSDSSFDSDSGFGMAPGMNNLFIVIMRRFLIKKTGDCEGPPTPSTKKTKSDEERLK